MYDFRIITPREEPGSLVEIEAVSPKGKAFLREMFGQGVGTVVEFSKGTALDLVRFFRQKGLNVEF